MKTLNTSPVVTNWYSLDWDFSDSDSVDFRYFEVSIDQFRQGEKNGYVIDSDGVQRIIDKKTLDDILESWEENMGDD